MQEFGKTCTVTHCDAGSGGGGGACMYVKMGNDLRGTQCKVHF